MTKKKILVVLGHPSEKSLNRSLADSYVEGAKERHDVRKLYLADLTFDPILREGYRGSQPFEEDLKKAQEDITWADHLVFVYPIWWGSVPALMKGFFDRTLIPGFAFKYVEGKPVKLLEGKTGSLIMTTGGPKFMYKTFGKIMNAPLTFGLMKFCGIKPKGQKFFCSITKVKDKRAKEIFEPAKWMGRKGF